MALWDRPQAILPQSAWSFAVGLCFLRNDGALCSLGLDVQPEVVTSERDDRYSRPHQLHGYRFSLRSACWQLRMVCAAGCQRVPIQNLLRVPLSASSVLTASRLLRAGATLSGPARYVSGWELASLAVGSVAAGM